MPSIRIVLYEPSHPGNIGAAARAMKNMNLTDLRIITQSEHPLNQSEAKARAAHALDILEQAQVIDSLEKAIGECQWVFGCSARHPDLALPVFTPKQAVEKINLYSNKENIAILFGPERTGLSAKVLSQCHAHLQIPANPDYPILNLAQAIQVVCYELFLGLNKKQNNNKHQDTDKLATWEQLEYFYAHLEQTMIKTRFLNPDNPKKLMDRCRLLFNRANLTEKEVQMLRGLLASV